MVFHLSTFSTSPLLALATSADLALAVLWIARLFTVTVPRTAFSVEGVWVGAMAAPSSPVDSPAAET